MKKWRWPFAGIAATMAVTLSLGLGGLAPSAAAASGPSSITLTEGVQVQPNWWFPNMPGQYCSTENVQFFDLAYRPLLWIANSDSINWGQSIATGITASRHDTVFTVHIGNQYKWSNGKPVTSYDVAYDAEVMLHTTSPGAVWADCGTGIGGYPKDWKSITTPNAHTMVVTTTVPVNPVWFEQNGLGQIYPVPKAVWDHSANWKAEESWILKVAVNPAAPQFDVVDGPYAYGPYVDNGYSTLVANAHYTGPNPAHIKRITLIYETSEQNLWAAALRGDLAQIAVPSQYNSQVATLQAHGYHVSKQPYGFCFDYAEPNLSTQDPVGKLLQQRYVRQALELGLNQRGMIKLAGNIGYPTYGPVPSEPPTVNYDPQVATKGYAYNPARGKRILEAHGWRMKNGVMTKNGQTLAFTLLYASGSQWVTDSVQLWQQGLKAEGIQLTVSSEPFNQVISTAFSKHNWQIAWWGGGWCYGINNYPTGAGLFEPGSSANVGAFNDPHLTALIQATHAPATPAQARERMFAYQLYAAQVLPFVYMPQVGGYQGTQPWLHSPGNSWSSIRNMWLFNYWYTTPSH